MSYEEISRRTIPQIMAILDGAEENISIKMGIPNIFGGDYTQTAIKEESTQEDVEDFFNSF